MKRYTVREGATGALVVESRVGGLVAFSDAGTLITALMVIRQAATTAKHQDEAMTCAAIVDMVNAALRSVGAQ